VSSSIDSSVPDGAFGEDVHVVDLMPDQGEISCTCVDLCYSIWTRSAHESPMSCPFPLISSWFYNLFFWNPFEYYCPSHAFVF